MRQILSGEKHPLKNKRKFEENDSIFEYAKLPYTYPSKVEK
jgi:hypothetical protein